jgi:hypothetical protein
MKRPGGDDMGNDTDHAPDDNTDAGAARRAARRRMLDDVFGEVLPEVTRDEIDDRQDGQGRDSDQWYRDNRPPHHG